MHSLLAITSVIKSVLSQCPSVGHMTLSLLSVPAFSSPSSFSHFSQMITVSAVCSPRCLRTHTYAPVTPLCLFYCKSESAPVKMRLNPQPPTDRTDAHSAAQLSFMEDLQEVDFRCKRERWTKERGTNRTNDEVISQPGSLFRDFTTGILISCFSHCCSHNYFGI